MKKCIFTFLAVFLFQPAMATENHGAHTSAYVGEEQREIKSLSPSDISDLQRGAGWGLAKAAELNGVPGPLHLLEMKDDIPLSAAQVREIEAIYVQMKATAIEYGTRLVDLERNLDAQFRQRTVTEESLEAILNEIEDTRMSLRYTHLATHLKTPKILTEAQIARYNQLRGYSDADPCSAVPEGHNAEMWRKHNGCD